MRPAEFDLIERFFRRTGRGRADVQQGIGDDGAVLLPPTGQDLIVSMDTLVAGVHFPMETAAEDIGHKALAVNLSDLAAMGAEPAWYTLSLTIPEADTAWLTGFSAGLSALADRYGMELVGGDTNRGPLSVTIQVHGFVPHGRAMYRHAARVGDTIYVTGELGDAGLALHALQRSVEWPSPMRAALMSRLNRPRPRVAEGRRLLDLAHAAIDVSDGLAADLGHVLRASGVGACIEMERIPVSSWMRRHFSGAGGGMEAAWALALTAGDDYELCFTAPSARRHDVETALAALSCPCACIGAVEAAPGLRCRFEDGREYIPSRVGYDHFNGG